MNLKFALVYKRVFKKGFSVKPAERIEAHSLIKAITEEDDHTFDAAKARRLVELLPVTHIPSLNVTFQNEARGKTRAYVPGVGNVEAEQSSSQRTRTTAENGMMRIGGYKVWHELGRVQIAHMDYEFGHDLTGNVCQLEYHSVSKDPRALKLARQTTIPISLFRVNLNLRPYRFVPWKKPVDVPASELEPEPVT